MDTTIDALTPEAPKSTTTRAAWAGRVLSGLPVLFLVFDVTIKLMGHPARRPQSWAFRSTPTSRSLWCCSRASRSTS
jgi:hypothetical protein